MSIHLWLKNEANLTELQLQTKRGLQRQRLKTARACQMRETLQEIYDTSADRVEAETGFKRLCSWMMRSRLEPMNTLASQFRRHWQDILATSTTGAPTRSSKDSTASSSTSRPVPGASAAWSTSPR